MSIAVRAPRRTFRREYGGAPVYFATVHRKHVPSVGIDTSLRGRCRNLGRLWR